MSRFAHADPPRPVGRPPQRFARSPEAPHLTAWRAFSADIRDRGDVGIWHETYRVGPGASESIFGNIPPLGLATAGTLAPVGSTSVTPRGGSVPGRPTSLPSLRTEEG